MVYENQLTVSRLEYSYFTIITYHLVSVNCNMKLLPVTVIVKLLIAIREAGEYNEDESNINFVFQ